jgi:hypothetical protein
MNGPEAPPLCGPRSTSRRDAHRLASPQSCRARRIAQIDLFSALAAIEGVQVGRMTPSGTFTPTVTNALGVVEPMGARSSGCQRCS